MWGLLGKCKSRINDNWKKYLNYLDKNCGNKMGTKTPKDFVTSNLLIYSCL